MNDSHSRRGTLTNQITQKYLEPRLLIVTDRCGMTCFFGRDFSGNPYVSPSNRRVKPGSQVWKVLKILTFVFAKQRAPSLRKKILECLTKVPLCANPHWQKVTHLTHPWKIHQRLENIVCEHPKSKVQYKFQSFFNTNLLFLQITSSPLRNHPVGIWTLRPAGPPHRSPGH